MIEKQLRPISKKIVATVNGNNDDLLDKVLDLVEKVWFLVKILIDLFRKNPKPDSGDK